MRYAISDMYGSEIINGTHVTHLWKSSHKVMSIVDEAAFGSKDYWASHGTLLSREQVKKEPFTERIVKLFTPWIKKLEPRLGK